jgi:hypothetical protein
LSVLRRSAVLTVLVSAALVVGVVSPASASTAQSAPLAPVSVHPAQPLPVPSARAKAPSARPINEGPNVSLGARSAPPVKFKTPSNTSSFDPKTSVPISYGSNDTIFKNKDGSKTKEVSATPLNLKKADGSWAPVATTVTQNVATGGFAAANNPLNPKFTKTLGIGADFTINSGSSPVWVCKKLCVSGSA